MDFHTYYGVTPTTQIRQRYPYPFEISDVGQDTEIPLDGSSPSNDHGIHDRKTNDLMDGALKESTSSSSRNDLENFQSTYNKISSTTSNDFSGGLYHHQPWPTPPISPNKIRNFQSTISTTATTSGNDTEGDEMYGTSMQNVGEDMIQTFPSTSQRQQHHPPYQQLSTPQSSPYQQFSTSQSSPTTYDNTDALSLFQNPNPSTSSSTSQQVETFSLDSIFPQQQQSSNSNLEDLNDSEMKDFLDFLMTSDFVSSSQIRDVATMNVDSQQQQQQQPQKRQRPDCGGIGHRCGNCGEYNHDIRTCPKNCSNCLSSDCKKAKNCSLEHCRKCRRKHSKSLNDKHRRPLGLMCQSKSRLEMNSQDQFLFFRDFPQLFVEYLNDPDHFFKVDGL